MPLPARAVPRARSGWSSSDGPRQRLAEFHQCQANSRFHRAEWLLEPIGDFCVRQPFIVRELDGDTLQQWQSLERGSDPRNLFGGQDLEIGWHAEVDDTVDGAVVSRLFGAG